MPSLGQTREVHYVFLSSPGDMEKERSVVCEFFESFNRSIAQVFEMRFEVLDWENWSNIGFAPPQTLITQQTLARFRKSLVLVVGLMGQRFGSPTERFGSGTEEEFAWAAKYRRKHGHPEIKWFFRRIEKLEVSPTDAEDFEEAVNQWRRVQKFRRQYSGFYKEFVDVNTFSQTFREDFFRWFSLWIVNRRTIKAQRPRSIKSGSTDVPEFLKNRLVRTLHIVTALEDFKAEFGGQVNLRLRICAAMSSLAIESGTSSDPSDEQYHRLLEQERELIEELFDRGASLNILFTWSPHEMLKWGARTRENVALRLKMLRNFCLATLKDSNKAGRATLVHIGIRERNLLILGQQYVFEGRKLSTKAGFEATQLITNKKRVTQEIEMFDILMRSAVKDECARLRIGDCKDLNSKLIGSLVRRIERDIKEIEEGRLSL